MVKTKRFAEFKQGLPDVSGKVFVITGTTSGAGFVAARTVAELGGEAVLLNRPSKRVETMMVAGTSVSGMKRKLRETNADKTQELLELNVGDYL